MNNEGRVGSGPRVSETGKNQDIVHELRAAGITLRATEQPIDTSTAAGKAFLDMLGVFAEFETNLRRERQMEGIAQAKAMGIYTGRKPSIDPAEVRRLRTRRKTWGNRNCRTTRHWSGLGIPGACQQRPELDAGQFPDGGGTAGMSGILASAIFPTNSSNGDCSGGFMPCAGQARIVRAHCSIRPRLGW